MIVNSMTILKSDVTKMSILKCDITGKHQEKGKNTHNIIER